MAAESNRKHRRLILSGNEPVVFYFFSSRWSVVGGQGRAYLLPHYREPFTV